MKLEDKSKFNLLKNRDIISILNGDIQFGRFEEEIKYSMTYLSGPRIIDISNIFGFNKSYCRTKSRKEYLYNLIEFCIEENKINDLLVYLFSKEQFKDFIIDRNTIEFEELYLDITNKALDRINNLLYFGKNKLSTNKDRSQFYIESLESGIKIEAPTIKGIDYEYVKKISERAMIDISNENYDSSITKARTLLEEVFCYAIEKKQERNQFNGDIGKMFKQVRGLYGMENDIDMDKRIKALLSGLNTIISSIAEMRNSNSDAHGVGTKRIRIDGYHARLCVNSAITISEFIISVVNRYDSKNS